MNNQKLNGLPILELKQINLNIGFHSTSLLRDISFQVHQGDRLAIVGPSGAGKTSLLRLLNRLIELSSGMITVEGEDLRTVPVRKLRSKVVLVPQEPKLLGMSVRDALAYPLVLQNLPKLEIEQRLQTWINKLHIPEDWLERNELQLSLGQRQLVSIARGLIMLPKILLLDEPTSALDAGRASYVLEILKELTDNHQITILMVNHQLDLAERFANRVLYLEAGKLVQDNLASKTNWQELRKNMMISEAKIAEEWH